MLDPKYAKDAATWLQATATAFTGSSVSRAIYKDAAQAALEALCAHPPPAVEDKDEDEGIAAALHQATSEQLLTELRCRLAA